MKKDITCDFQIKLNFNKNAKDPSRLFHSFASLIDGVSQLDKLIAQSVNSTVISTMHLDDVEKGSLIGKLFNCLVISEDDQIENLDDKSDIKGFVEESRSESLDFLEKGDLTFEKLQDLTNRIQTIAEEKGVSDSFNYSAPNTLQLASTLNQVSESTSALEGNESFVISKPNEEGKTLKAGLQKIDIESIENALTENEITNEFEAFYKIKKPDFLGDSQWEFKYGNKPVKIKISHEAWLDDFHNGRKIVLPGVNFPKNQTV